MHYTNNVCIIQIMYVLYKQCMNYKNNVCIIQIMCVLYK